MGVAVARRSVAETAPKHAEDFESKGLATNVNPVLPKQRVASSTLVSRSNLNF